MKYYVGMDIGGTKCAVVAAEEYSEKMLDKISFPTKNERGAEAVISELLISLKSLLERNGIDKRDVISCGVSCGGPLDPNKGIIMSPPNLVGWDNIPLADIITGKFGFPCKICNDADACALAEWKFGSGKGTENMIFLTFGTGMGAGLILNGKLYSGSNGLAGEVGHIRLAENGTLGYGKYGSFEGFCSGGGIERTAVKMLAEYSGKTSVTPENATAKELAQAARNGDEFALSVYEKCGEMLGKGIAVLIDILNPEVIVIGSVYQRSGDLLFDSMQKSVKAEALPSSSEACRILPAMLGDEIGDYAAIGVAKSIVTKDK